MFSVLLSQFDCGKIKSNEFTCSKTMQNKNLDTNEDSVKIVRQFDGKGIFLVSGGFWFQINLIKTNAVSFNEINFQFVMIHNFISSLLLDCI